MVLTGANNAGAVAVGAGAGAWMAKLDGLTLGNGLVWLARLSLTAMPAKWQRVTDEGSRPSLRDTVRATGCGPLGPCSGALLASEEQGRNCEAAQGLLHTINTERGPVVPGEYLDCGAEWAICVRRAMGSPRPSQVAWHQSRLAGPCRACLSVCLPVCLSVCLLLSCLAPGAKWWSQCFHNTPK